MRYLLIKLLFFVLLAYTQIVLAESKDEKCNKIFSSIIANTELAEQQKLNQWAKYKKFCSEDNFYYIGKASIYGLQDSVRGFNYIQSLLEKRKISYTKEIIFFLGICYDAAYALIGQKDALEILIGFADILINDYKNSATGFFLKGCYFFHKNDFDKAEYYYKKAKELSETSNDKLFETITIRDLTIKRGAILAYKQNEFEFCIGFYKKAFELNQFGTLADSFASNTATRALIKIGNCKDARKLMDLRKELFPQITKGKNFIELEQEYSQACEK